MTTSPSEMASLFIPNLAQLIEEIPPESIVSRTVYRDKTVKVVLFGFAAGEGLSEHTAAKAAILYFVQGEATVTLGDETQTAAPGTFIHMPPKLTHGVTAHSDVLMLLLLLN